MGTKFLYGNSKIRVGEPSRHPRTLLTTTWYPDAKSLWSYVDWSAAQSYVYSNCHGTPGGAMWIELALNKLDKYVGANGQTTVDPNDLGFGINQALVSTLNEISLGTSGTALSLLSYKIGGSPAATATNAGYSFEHRMSEFIQRLADTFQGDVKAYNTGADQVYVGYAQLAGGYTGKVDSAKLHKAILEDINRDASSMFSYMFDEIVKKIDGSVDSEIALMSYKVPQKADITVPNDLVIHGRYGPLVTGFLQAISGARISLKNTAANSSIKLGETNDNTRLRGFVSQFANNIARDFASVCTFIFASKNSGKVDKELDWARILYELLGTGQHMSVMGDDNLLVDYLIINQYDAGGSGGHASVFNVKDLISAFPQGDYYPPFKISGSNHEGPVTLDLNSVKSFSFS